MPSVTQAPQIIHHHTTTNTNQGEVTINLNLTITINQDGSVMVASAPKEKQQQAIVEDKVKDNLYAIPEFEATELLPNFGENSRW